MGKGRVGLSFENEEGSFAQVTLHARGPRPGLGIEAGKDRLDLPQDLVDASGIGKVHFGKGIEANRPLVEEVEDDEAGLIGKGNASPYHLNQVTAIVALAIDQGIAART
jgi:hypothetical protein